MLYIAYLDIPYCMMFQPETSNSKINNLQEEKVLIHSRPAGRITTKDEIRDPQNLQIVTKVNGETRQNSSSSKMVISIEKLISSLSKVMTLESGDIISTGTPAGVAMSMKEPRYLKDGDVVEITIENLVLLEIELLLYSIETKLLRVILGNLS